VGGAGGFETGAAVPKSGGALGELRGGEGTVDRDPVASTANCSKKIINITV